MAARVRSTVVFGILDSLVVIAAYGVAELVFLRNRAPSHYWHRFLPFVLAALVLQLVANRVFGLYGRIWRHAGIEEARNIVLASSAVMTVMMLLYPLLRMLRVGSVPLAVLPLGALLTTCGIGVMRFHSRLLGWQRSTRRMGLRVAVVGCRDAGAAVVREMLRSPLAGLFPVAVFDDDPRTHGLSVIGVPVVGSVDDLPEVAARLQIQQVVLAMPAPPTAVVERCLAAAETAGIALKIIPGVRDVVGSVTSPLSVRAAREPRIEDLLGRTQVTTDLAAVRSALQGKIVLVTGAGGSIGSEICRQVSMSGPALIVLFDRDETHLHDAIAGVTSPAQQVLGDIADLDALSKVFDEFKPEVVFHAAAHKHVPILESHVVEAVVTNVIGTCNVIEAAVSSGVERFVFVSTDKAVRPTSVMGATKRLGELVVHSQAPHGTAFCAVRFGNVLGSRGSVIPTFRKQIEAGGPVTVTDPRMTRFFMSVEEAVQLVLQASVLANGGDVFMLEMGEPMRILDLAKRMIRLSGLNPGTDIPIRIIGPRPGEKVHEELHSLNEALHETVHPSIKRLVAAGTAGDALDVGLAELRAAVACRNADLARQVLFELATDVPRPAAAALLPAVHADRAGEAVPA